MEEEKKTGRKPDFTGNGIAVWVNVDEKTKKKYLSINLVGHGTVYARMREDDEK